MSCRLGVGVDKATRRENASNRKTAGKRQIGDLPRKRHEGKKNRLGGYRDGRLPREYVGKGKRQMSDMMKRKEGKKV